MPGMTPQAAAPAIRILVVDAGPEMRSLYRDALDPPSRFAPEFARDAREATAAVLREAGRGLRF